MVFSRVRACGLVLMSVALVGLGLAPSAVADDLPIGVNPTSVDFGQVPVDFLNEFNYAEDVIQVAVPGDTEVKIFNYSIVGAPSDFTAHGWPENPCEGGTVLGIGPDAGDRPTCYITVRFTPSTFDVTDDVLEIRWQDLTTFESGVIDVPLSGQAVPLPGAPPTPTDVVAIPGPGSATVSWTPGADNGNPVTDFVIVASPGGEVASVDASHTNTTVTGLTNGLTYTFTVHALNDCCRGLPSEPSNPVTPTVGPPLPPTGVVASAGDEQASVQWIAPGDNGSPIESYTVTASPGGLSLTVPSSQTTVTIRGLTNGTTYSFAVTATNAFGASQPSAQSNPVTPSPTISIGDAAIVEGESGSKTMKFPVTLSRRPSTALTLYYVLTGVTATEKIVKGQTGADYAYTGSVHELTINPDTRKSAQSKTYVKVTIYGDTQVEPDETFIVTLYPTNPAGFVYARSQATGTILNDD